VARVIGIGQPVAGDDGVGCAVVAALRAAPPEGTELTTVREASALIPILTDTRERVVLVDAVIGAGAPGQVSVLDTNAIDVSALSSVSSHGLAVGQALELARALSSEPMDVHVVAISIAPPERYGEGLSGPVEAAVPKAAAAIRQLVERRT
jgi:hydrogenase maturation protease